MLNPFAWISQLVTATQAKRFDDEEPFDEENGDPDAEVEPVVIPDAKPTDRRHVLRVGAWAGWGSMSNDKAIARDVAFAKSVGLSRLDIVCNDHAGDRAPRAFGTYPEDRIVALALAAFDAGLEVHLMTWCMPHAEYLGGMASTMLRLTKRCGAASVQLDAEEPWTQAKSPMAYDSAAELVASLLLGVRWGVTGIGYTPVNKVGPLITQSDYMVPQCYSTTSSGLSPGTVAPRLVARWRGHFGDRELVVGLAGYRQGGIPGHTVDSAMRAAFKGATEVGASAAVYWSLRHLRTNKGVANTLKYIIAQQRL
jgi:hypothetical protein